jgi:hypothetical protein
MLASKQRISEHEFQSDMKSERSEFGVSNSEEGEEGPASK